MILQIVLLILLFIYTVVFIYAITHHLLILKKELITKNKIYIKKVDKLEENYQNKFRELNQQFTQTQQNYYEQNKAARNACDEIQSIYNKMKATGVQQIEEQLELYKEKERNKVQNLIKEEERELRENLAKQLELYIINTEENKKILNEEISELEDILKDYKEKREIINKAILHEKEIREQQDFFRVLLKENDKKDIEVLLNIEKTLYNREALYKLIYDVFIKKPLNDMLARVLKGKDICGIYKITNIKTQESYIGKSTNIKTRWTNHIKTALGLDGMARTKIHSAMKEYGLDNFTFEVLEECTKENYSEKEKYWINFYETNIYGYNIQK